MDLSFLLIIDNIYEDKVIIKDYDGTELVNANLEEFMVKEYDLVFSGFWQK